MQRKRRVVVMSIVACAAVWWVVTQYIAVPTPTSTQAPSTSSSSHSAYARDVLETLAVKGRAAKTDYARTQYGDGWTTVKGCDSRNIILNRDMEDVVVDESCYVTKGILHDPYTGHVITFARGTDTSDDVQIDHVVALSNAWQTGAQQLTREKRIELANDPLELLAVDGPTNQAKGDGDAATWLPPNKAFRCQYVARQIAVKAKYTLWVTSAEKRAMQRILSDCADQRVPS